MLKLCIEGWKYINNSIAIVNQRQLLELLNLPIYLRHKDVPYFNKNWNSIKNANGFSDEENLKLKSIKDPKKKEIFDVIYRISSPFNLSPSDSKKTYTFATKEFELDKSLFVNFNLNDFNNCNNSFIHTPSNWSKKGFLDFGFRENQIKVIPLGVDPKIFFSNKPR